MIACPIPPFPGSVYTLIPRSQCPRDSHHPHSWFVPTPRESTVSHGLACTVHGVHLVENPILFQFAVWTSTPLVMQAKDSTLSFLIHRTTRTWTNATQQLPVFPLYPVLQSAFRNTGESRRNMQCRRSTGPKNAQRRLGNLNMSFRLGSASRSIQRANATGLLHFVWPIIGRSPGALICNCNLNRLGHWTL